MLAVSIDAATYRFADDETIFEALIPPAASPPDVAACCERALAVCLSGTGACAGTIVLVGPDGESLQIVADYGYPHPLVERWQRFPLSADTPLSKAVRTGRPHVACSRQEWTARYPHMAVDPQISSHEARAAFPLAVGGRVLGAIGLSFDYPQTFSAPQTDHLRALANRCALAIERELLRAERAPSPGRFGGEPAADEARLALALEAAGMGAWDLDILSRRVYLTERCCALAGLDGPREVTVEELVAWLSPADAENILRILGEALAARRGDFRVEVDVPQPDGTARRIAAYGRLLCDAAGNRVRAIGVSRDVTTERTAVAALRMSEERYRSLVQATAQIVWTTDGAGNIRSRLRSPGFTETAAGVESPAEWLQVVHPEDRAATLAAWRTAETTRSPFEVEHRIRRDDGEFRTLHGRVVPVMNEDGTVREWVGVHTDVTTQRALERQQRQFIRDVLYSVTEGRLRLCDTPADLPTPLATPADGSAESISLTSASLADVRRCVHAAALAAGFTAERAMGLMSAASECAMNAVTHGGADATARVVAAEDGSVLQVWIADHGRGIDVSELPKATLMRGYSGAGSAGGFGHGFFLVLANTDTVHLLTGAGGTTVVLEHHREPPSDLFGL